MSGVRYFNGSRQGQTVSPALALKKMELQKKGKLPAKVRFQYILKKKMEAKMGINTDPATQKKEMEALLEAGGDAGKINKITGRTTSKRAQQAMREMAMKKAHKEERILRQMVIVRPQGFSNGSINGKGKIYDVAGNMIGQVNTKNGKMATMNGWNFGKYKPKNMRTNLAIQNAINTHSPYYINLRKMQAMQEGAGAAPVVNLYGHAGSSPLYGNSPTPDNNYYGSDVVGPRQNIGMTAWGAMSNNVFGTFADNAWGTVSDNAWGTASTDVWGGISAGGLWGVKGPKIWGTGNGTNYLKGISNFMAAMFGLKTKGKWSKGEKKAIFAKRGGSAGRTATVVRRSARR